MLYEVITVSHAEAKGILHSKRNWRRTLKGVGASSGVAIAQAWVWQPKMELSQVHLKKTEEPELQLELLDQALLQVQLDLDALALRFSESVSEDSTAIFQIYQHLLADPGFLKPIREAIGQQHWTAASAVRRVSERLIEQFSAMSDGYLKERALDVRDLAQRLLSRLSHSHIEQFDS